MRKLIELANKLNDHLIGDAIGALSLFATIYILLVLGQAFFG